MNEINNKQAISKTSYYCQSIYTTINLFCNLVESRKYDLLNDLLMKIIEDISQCLYYYSQNEYNIVTLDDINNKLELIIEGYKNFDYFYIKDIFQYELLTRVEKIFNEIKEIIIAN